jgi:integrase
MIEILLADREKYQRIHAGVPDNAQVDLSLVRLPAKALMFPSIEAGTEFDFAAPRNPRNFSKEFARRAGLLGFGATRFHDLRGIHSTALLDSGVPVHIVAQRIGDDPAVLLRNYVKRRRTNPHFSHCGVNRRGLCGFDGCLLAEPCGMVAPKALAAIWVCVSPWAGR